MSRKATNLSIDAGLVSDAKAMGINLSQAAEQGISDAIRKAAAEKWQAENLEAMEDYNAWIEDTGLPLNRYRRF